MSGARFADDAYLVDQQARWDECWRQPDFWRPWFIETVPDAIRRNVELGWLKPGMTLLDIGCGAGHIAAWLAEHGFDVLGIDFAPQAVERARRAYGHVPRLAFEVVDACDPNALGRQFDALIDRGCLHIVGKNLRSRYVDNVARWAGAEAPFLLLMRCKPEEGGLAKLGERVRETFAPAFELIDFAETSLAGPDAPHPLPAGVFRLCRRVA
jgi:cyclopropane fatty-acyl-phospholipid synthase-like methyltransferase